MSQNNALNRLVSKQKPKVPPRGDVISESVNNDVKAQRQQDLDTPLPVIETEASTQENNLQISHDSKTSFSQDIKAKIGLGTFETVRNTIRIESEVDESLRQLCHQERITKETWLEAAYLYLEVRPEELAEVIRLAQERLSQRKAIADYKRAKTMQERFL